MSVTAGEYVNRIETKPGEYGERQILPDSFRDTSRISPTINRSEILVVAKKSKFLREQEKTDLSHSDHLAQYSRLGESGDCVVSSHFRQEAAIELCAELFSLDQVVNIDDMGTALASGKFKAIIALGGDDFFKLVSNKMPQSTLLLGVNSDPTESRGFLLPVSIDELPAFITLLERGVYSIEEWSRVRVSVNGVERGSAINDIALGKKDFSLTSHFEVEYRGKQYSVASSGILVSTGVGSTGWFLNGGMYINHDDRTFPRTAKKVAFELLTPLVKVSDVEGRRKITLPDLVEGELLEGEVLRVVSKNDDEAFIAKDSLDRVPFQRGTVAEVSLDPNPSKVIVKYHGE
jgi:NAD kinase